MRSLLAALLFALAIPAGASALGPGDLDPGFGIDGTVFTSLGPLVEPGTSVADARDVASAADVGITVVGSAPGESGERALAIARYRPSGRPDRDFGEDGVVVRQFGTGTVATSTASAVLALDDGGAIVAGSATDIDHRTSVLLVRFGPTGRIVWATQQQVSQSGDSAALELAADRQNRILVVGRAALTPDVEPFIARFEATAGTLDLTFNGRGYWVDPVPRSRDGSGCTFGGAQATSVVAAEDGSAVVGGTLARTCPGDRQAPVALLRRYDSTGGRDSKFGSDELGLDAVTTILDAPFRGGIVLAGSVAESSQVPGIARYVAGSGLDFNFPGPSGFGPLPGFATQPGAVVSAAVTGTEGKLVLGVDLDDPERGDRIVRTDGGGQRDDEFGARGLTEAKLRSPRALAVQGNKRIIVIGDQQTLSGREQQGFLLARLFGGEAVSRVTLGTQAPERQGSLRVRLRCSAGPGCEGVVRGGKLGVVTYAARGGSSFKVEVPVRETARNADLLAVTVTNAPAEAVRKRVSVIR